MILHLLVAFLLSLPVLIRTQTLHVCALVTIPSIERAIPNNTYLGLYDTQSINMVQGWTLWKNVTDAKGGIKVGINETLHSLDLTIINSGETNAKTVAAGKSAVNGTFGHCDFIFAPFSSGLTQALAPVVEAARIPTIAGFAAAGYIFQCQEPLSSPCRAVNTRRYQWSWSIIPSSEYFFEGVFSMFALKGAKSVSAWASDDLFTKAVVKGAVDSALSNGMVHLGTIIASVVPNATEFQEIVSTLKKYNADIIISANRRSSSCIPFIQEMKRQNLNPKAITVSQCIVDGAVRATLGDDMKYLIDYNIWDQRARGLDFTDTRVFPPTLNETSGKLFNDKYKEMFGKDSDPLGTNCAAFAMGLATEAVLSKVESLDANEINSKMSLVFETSVFGTLGYNVYGMNDKKELPVIQTDKNNVIQIVTPLASATMQIIYPFPEWNLRDFQSVYLGNSSEIVIFVIFIVLEVVSITLMFFLYTHWDSKNVKAGQRIFLALMVIGTFFVYLTVPFWMLHQERVFCHLRYWFLSIGFTLLFGSLTLKTFRIKSIFVSSMALKSAKAYTDNQMLSLLGVLLFIDILICLIWSAASPASVVVIEIDTFRQAHNYYQCSYPPTAIVMLIIMLLYKTFMICFGLYLSVLLWMYGFGNSMFVESRQTIFSMYNVIICVVVGVALEVTLTTSDSRETLFVARSICIFLTGFMTIMAILAPRLTDPEGLEHQGNDLTGQSNGSKSQQSLSTIQSADYEQVTRKYAALVKRYKLKHPDSDVEDDVYVS